MYVVTFYSFKGGVGRTLGLINVGVELARMGRRVLIVDFDLEAPGLETFNLARPVQGNKPGMVEYVSSYLQTGHAPDVADFMYESVGEWKGEGRLWIMPAGIQDESYQSRLNSIDWKMLYRERDGYLLFEDMKKQWEEQLAPDYVLIDSRTGYSDESGICTRQLPDAVTILFFPNDQNLFGLKKVVSDVRNEAIGPRQKTIQLHFVTSNVPDIDDEDQILEGRMARFQEYLGYKNLAGIIHHYNSLALLNQVIFTSERPRSRLAQEYRSLVKDIIRHNVQDPEGARDFLRKVSRSVHRFIRDNNLSSTELERRLESIRMSHLRDGEILYHLALIREQQGFPNETLQLLQDAVSSGYRTPEVFGRLAGLYWAGEQRESALASVRNLLDAPESTYFDVNLAIRILRKMEVPREDFLNHSRALKDLDTDERIEVTKELQKQRDDLPLAISILEKLSRDKKSSNDQNSRAKNDRVLCLIGVRRYRDAMELIGQTRPTPESLDEFDAFNYAMAEWGLAGLPPKDMMQRVQALHEQGQQTMRTANYMQCMAFVCWVLGDLSKAHEWLNQARRKIAAGSKITFSAWRYLYVNESKFLNDLRAFEEMLEGADSIPPFLKDCNGEKA